MSFNNEMKAEEIPQELLNEIGESFGDFSVDLWDQYDEESKPKITKTCKSFKSEIESNKEKTEKTCYNSDTGDLEKKNGESFETYAIRMEFPSEESNVKIPTLRKVQVIKSFREFENS